jgi:hypothetical protein
MKWLFLVHQIHSPNSRERVKVWRAIKKTGAILYRNSVYVLPYNKERLEDFQWVCQQINDSRGESSVFVSNAQTEEENSAIRDLFRKARKEDYDALLSAAEELQRRVQSTASKGLSDRLRTNLLKETNQLREAHNEIRKIDFFSQSPPRQLTEILEDMTAKLSRNMETKVEVIARKTRSIREFQKKIWATRQDIHIDRICSAWLIRRFIDPSARFVFAPENKLPKNAVPFDVFGAEFSHHGEDCTFETLMKVFRIRDRAVSELAEIIHDIDLKDRKFERLEANGLDMVIRSLSESVKDDHQRLEIGTIILDGLYKFFSKPAKEGKRK